MRALSAPALAALSRTPLPIALLVEMDLTVPLYLNSSPINLVIGGNTYLGTKKLGKVEAITETPAEIKPLRFELSGVPVSAMSLVRTEQVQGKAVRIKVCIFDPDTYLPLDTRLRWAGRLDVLAMEDGPTTAKIQVTAEHIAIDFLRPVTSLYSDAEQRRLYSNDPSLQYIADQTEVRVIWPTAEFLRR